MGSPSTLRFHLSSNARKPDTKSFGYRLRERVAAGTKVPREQGSEKARKEELRTEGSRRLKMWQSNACLLRYRMRVVGLADTKGIGPIHPIHREDCDFSARGSSWTTRGCRGDRCHPGTTQRQQPKRPQNQKPGVLIDFPALTIYCCCHGSPGIASLPC